jgi:hypothetical protein
MRLTVSMATMRFMRCIDSTRQASTAFDPPVRPLPAPRGTTGAPAARAAASAATTSSVDRGITSTAAVPGCSKMARSCA